MKRSNQGGNEPGKKYIKLRGSNPKFDDQDSKFELPDEILNEIMSWFPHNFIAIVCSSINRQWRRVVLNYSRLKFHLKESQWVQMRLQPSEIMGRIHKMKIEGENTSPLNCSGFSSMSMLKHVHLHGFELDGYIIGKMLQVETLEKVTLSSCVIDWKELAAFTDPDRQVYLSFSGCELNIRLGETEKYHDILSRIKFLQCAQGECEYYSQHYHTLCESLSNAKHLNDVSICVDDTTSNYLLLMNNLTNLRIEHNLRTSTEPLDLSGLVRLKSLWLNSRPRHPQLSLGNVLANLSRLSITGNWFVPQEWNSLDRLHKLKSLELRDAELGSSWKFPNGKLERLELTRCRIDERALDSLKNLSTLSILIVCGLDIESVDPNFSNRVESRSFTFADICFEKDNGAECKMTSLKELVAVFPPENSKSLSVLSRMGDLSNLTLYTEDMSQAGHVHIRWIASAPRLETLHLENIMLSRECTKNLSLSRSITSLELCGMSLESVQMEHLSFMSRLRHLCISSSEIDLAGLEHIAGMDGLSSLSVNVTSMDDACIDVLSSMTQLKSLSVACGGLNRDLIDASLRSKFDHFSI